MTRTEAAHRPVFAPSSALILLRTAADLLDAEGDAAAERIVDELARDYPRSLRLRPAQVVRAAGVRLADLHRLVTAAGFVDHDDLRRSVERELPGRRTSPRASAHGPSAVLRDTVRREQDALADTMLALRTSGALELAAAAILAGRRRWVFGDLRSRGYAQLFSADLTTALGQVLLVDPTSSGVLAAVGDAQRRDSLTVFSFRRYSRLTVRLTQQFAERGATVVAITDSESSPVGAQAAHVLRVVPSDEHSSTAVVAVGHALAALAAAGAKGASRRARQEQTVAASMQWYAEDDR